MNTNKNDGREAVMQLATALAGIDLTGGKNPLITSKGKPSGSKKKKGEVTAGDWLRVKKGPIEGAEGSVVKAVKTGPGMTIVEIRQLNGNTIRLPRAYFEFAAFNESTVDRL